MKIWGLWTIILGLTLASCNQEHQTSKSTDNPKENLTSSKEIPGDKSMLSESSNEKEEIQNLIRKVLIWADSKKTIDLLPMLTDNNDSIYIGFDLDKHNQNLEILKETSYFTTDFIDNYNRIILTLDKGIKNGNYDTWLVGDMPTFIFASDANPWCDCQDNMEWNKVQIKINSLDDKKGEIEWYWGSLSANTHESWKEFSYNFSVIKNNGRWKISHMEGFDFKENTRKDGQL